jgi:hypothetical protein
MTGWIRGRIGLSMTSVDVVKTILDGVHLDLLNYADDAAQIKADIEVRDQHQHRGEHQLTDSQSPFLRMLEEWMSVPQSSGTFHLLHPRWPRIQQLATSRLV